MARGPRLALTLATTVFFCFCTKFFSLRFLFCSLTKIESFKSFWKYLSIVDFVVTLIKLYSNKINRKYLR